MDGYVNIVVQGCTHGSLNKTYDQIELLERGSNIKVDLFISCGDFQPVRNEDDKSLLIIPKNKFIPMDFADYYFGRKIAPYLTIFTAGNHEVASILWELPYGGWIAKNIYYLGYSNTVIFRGLKICSVGGIFKAYNYQKPHNEKPPFDNSTLRSIYHTREIDIFKLSLMEGQKIDIAISHDWPSHVYKYGDTTEILKYHPHLENDINSDSLGDKNKFILLHKLAPKYWFSGHIHAHFESEIPTKNSETIFCALDRNLPRRTHMKLFKFKVETDDNDLYYDPYWLSILKKTGIIEKNNKSPDNEYFIPKIDCKTYFPTQEDIFEIENIFNKNFKIPKNFKCLLLNTNSSDYPELVSENIINLINNQTFEFCQLLGLHYDGLVSNEEIIKIANEEEIILD